MSNFQIILRKPKTSNKKSAQNANLLDLTSVGVFGLSPYCQYRQLKSFVKSSVDNFYKTVEVGGIEPPRSQVTIRDSRLGATTADLLYQTQNDLQNAEY